MYCAVGVTTILGDCLSDILFVGKDVTYLCPFSGPARGVSYVTNYKLVFKADEVRSYDYLLFLVYIFQILTFIELTNLYIALANFNIHFQRR